MSRTPESEDEAQAKVQRSGKVQGVFAEVSVTKVAQSFSSSQGDASARSAIDVTGKNPSPNEAIPADGIATGVATAADNGPKALVQDTD